MIEKVKKVLKNVIYVVDLILKVLRLIAESLCSILIFRKGKK